MLTLDYQVKKENEAADMKILRWAAVRYSLDRTRKDVYKRQGL